MALAGRGFERDDRVGVKDVGGKRGWLGVRTDFHFSPSAYVKMLSLSPSQVLPLQMPELSVRSVRGGKREEVWEDFHFKQAQLCHTVT